MTDLRCRRDALARASKLAQKHGDIEHALKLARQAVAISKQIEIIESSWITETTLIGMRQGHMIPV